MPAAVPVSTEQPDITEPASAVPTKMPAEPLVVTAIPPRICRSRISPPAANCGIKPAAASSVLVYKPVIVCPLPSRIPANAW